METPRPQKAFIIGAGIGGLTAAWRLQQAGFDVEVFEREAQASGRVKSLRIGEQVLDTGATVFLSAYAETHALLAELGLDRELEPIRGKAVIVRDGRQHLLDLDAPLKALFTPALSWRSKLSLIKLLLKLWSVRKSLNFLSLGAASGQDLETLEEYCRRSFPDEVYRYLLNPALKFLYLHNGRSGSLIELLWWMKASGLGQPQSLRCGTSSLTDALASRLKVHVNAEVTEVRRTASGVELLVKDESGALTIQMADACILSVPGTIAAEICKDGLSDQQRTFLQSRRYDRSIVVSFCTRKRPALDALMFMVSDDLDADVATIIFGHHIGPKRSPDDLGIVNAYFMHDWSESHWHDDDESLMRAAQARIRRIVPEVADLQAWNVQRWSHAAAITETGDCEKIRRFEQDVNPSDCIQLMGDYQAQASMNVAVANANRLARRLIERRSAGSGGQAAGQ